MTDTWSPEDYSRHSSVQQQWGLELLDKLQLKEEDHVLDIGCGDGRTTALIATMASKGQVVGVDRSEAMVASATASFPTEAYPNLRFEQCDARSLSFEGLFTAVFSNATLHWVDDHRAVLYGIARSLKPGGRALLQMGGHGNAAEVIEVLNDRMQQPRWQGYFRNFQFPYTFHHPDDYKPWLGELGLTAQRVELIPKQMQHPDVAAFAGWIRTTWMPFTHCVPETRRDQFIDDFVNSYLTQYPKYHQGTVMVKMVRLEAHLIRA